MGQEGKPKLKTVLNQKQLGDECGGYRFTSDVFLKAKYFATPGSVPNRIPRVNP